MVADLVPGLQFITGPHAHVCCETLLNLRGGQENSNRILHLQQKKVQKYSILKPKNNEINKRFGSWNLPHQIFTSHFYCVTGGPTASLSLVHHWFECFCYTNQGWFSFLHIPTIHVKQMSIHPSCRGVHLITTCPPYLNYPQTSHIIDTIIGSLLQ